MQRTTPRKGWALEQTFNASVTGFQVFTYLLIDPINLL